MLLISRSASDKTYINNLRNPVSDSTRKNIDYRMASKLLKALLSVAKEVECYVAKEIQNDSFVMMVSVLLENEIFINVN